MASVNRNIAIINNSGAYSRNDHTEANNNNNNNKSSDHNDNNNTMNMHSGEANTQSISRCTKSIDGYKVAIATAKGAQQLCLSGCPQLASQQKDYRTTHYVRTTTTTANHLIHSSSILNLHNVVVVVVVVASQNETSTTNKLLLSSLLDVQDRTVDNLKSWPTFVSSIDSNNSVSKAIVVDNNENIKKNCDSSFNLTAAFISSDDLDTQQNQTLASSSEDDDVVGIVETATGRTSRTSKKHASEKHRLTMTPAKKRKESCPVKLNTNHRNNRLSLTITSTSTSKAQTTAISANKSDDNIKINASKISDANSNCCLPSQSLTVAAENRINTKGKQHLHHQLSSTTCLILFILKFGIIYESHHPSTLNSSSSMMASALDYRPRFGGSSVSSHHYQRPNDKLLSKRFSEPQAPAYKQDSKAFVYRYRNYFIPTTTTTTTSPPSAKQTQSSQSGDKSRLYPLESSHVGKTKSLTNSHSGTKSPILAQSASAQSNSLYYYYQTAIDRHKQTLMNSSSVQVNGLAGQQHLTKQQPLTTSLYRNIIDNQQALLDWNAIKLGSVCRYSRDCSPHIQNSHCDGDNSTCQCLPYYVPLNSTVCLPPVLLSYSCQIDSQCTKKVSNSHCLEGVCQCQTDFVAHRKDKCLAPAVLNDYCLKDEQCKLNNGYSFCKWIIPHIYGKCKCPINHLVSNEHCYPRLEDECKLDEHCQMATANSYCRKAAHRASRSQFIMTPQCACKEGYEMSANKMYCLVKLVATTTTLPISINQISSSSRDRTNNTNQKLTGMISTTTPVSLLPLIATTSNYDDSLMNVTIINNHHHLSVPTTTTTSSPPPTTATVTTSTQQQLPSIISSSSDGASNNRIDSVAPNKILTNDYVTTPTTTPTDKQQTSKNGITVEPWTKDKTESDKIDVREEHMNKVEKEKNKYVIIQDNSSSKTQGNNDDLSGSMIIDIQSSSSQEFHLANMSQPLESMKASTTNDDIFSPTTPVSSLFPTSSSKAPETSTIETTTDKYHDKRKFSSTTKLPILSANHVKSDVANHTGIMMKQASGSNNTAATTTSTTTSTTTTESSVSELSRYKAISLGKKCKHSKECQLRDPYSDCIDGYCECMRPTSQCSAKATGCLKDTYQCRNGQCISWYFVCDKFKNCDDGSDEDECVPHKCPKEAFQCDDGTCLQRSKVCNGHWECPDGSDEARCYKGISCDSNAFRCRNGQCLPQYVFCNAVEDCLDGSDEIEQICENNNMAQISTAVVSATSRQRKYHKKFGQSSRVMDSSAFNNDTISNMPKCPAESFTCSNGKCRSTAILCSGVDGCGDGSDEDHCEVCSCESPLNSPLSYVNYEGTHPRRLRGR